MRVLTAALVGNPLPEHIKVTVFMDGLIVGPARTQLFRVHANTMEVAIQIALREEYSHRQARTPATTWQGNSAPGSAQGGSPRNGATSGPVPLELGLAEQRDIRCFGCGRLGHMKRVCPARGQQKPSFGKSSGSMGCVQQPRPKSQGNVGHHLSETRQWILGGGTKGPDGSLKFEDFDSTERFIVLEMDKYDLILGMPWLEKHEPWIDWRGKAIGASRPALFDRALVSHVPTSFKSKGVRQDRQGTSAPEEVMGVAEAFGVPQKVTVDSVKESAEALPGVKPSEPRAA
ncbi:unnamed protein product [Phytophthora fragariaefolia]|uniref:Unnamed protein product n=1 Tax=Phytophthora fragariaefolia TaxID=1490495 RepID=A0A9W7CL42_9STRA|nr:unnamed protein product [Phytophthora fragariaefolia]